MQKNLYEILEISPDATQNKIKAAMIRLGKIYAPQAQTNEVARIYLKKITQAYQILSNPYQRANYNNLLKKSLEQKKRSKEYWQNKIEKWVERWKITKQWFIKGWQIIKQWFIKGWQITKQWLTKEPKFPKHWFTKKRKIIKRHVVEKKLVSQILEKKSNADELSAPNQKMAKKKIVKGQTATKHIKNILIQGEKVIYQAHTHWFFYLDFGAVLLVILSGYLLAFNPDFIGKDMPTMLVWVPEFVSKDLLEMPVWRLGLIALLLVGLMMLWEAFIVKQTTQLGMTSKRVFFKCGLLSQTVIELKLNRIESITIHQSIFGVIFNYGTIKIIGMGGVKTIVPNIVAPSKFKKILWRVLDKYGEEVEYVIVNCEL
jgi:hypothetical protein